MFPNSKIDAICPLHFYKAMCNRLQSTQTVVVVNVVSRWMLRLFDSLLVFTNQAKTKLKKLITYRCKKLILSVFRAKMFFQHFMGYKIHFVNQTGSDEKWVLLIDVKSWFLAFFAPKQFSAIFCYKLKQWIFSGLHERCDFTYKSKTLILTVFSRQKKFQTSFWL